MDSCKSHHAHRELPPADLIDPVVEAYKQHVDRTLLRENLKLTVAERFSRFHHFMQGVYALGEAGQRARAAGRQANDG